MLVITGIFENERFIPDKSISIPQKKSDDNNRRRITYPRQKGFQTRNF